jgi:hypothetical protein
VGKGAQRAVPTMTESFDVILFRRARLSPRSRRQALLTLRVLPCN